MKGHSPTVMVLKLIVTRFLKQLGPHLLWLVIAPIVFVVLLNFFGWIAAYIECRTLDNPSYWNRTPNPGRAC
jgi:hypothetical protein